MYITLFCVLQGTLNPFPVDIDRNLTVGHLKDAIKAKKPNDFVSIDADRLRLWQVEIRNRDDLTNLALQNNDELVSMTRLSGYFPEQLPDNVIHIVIKLPFLSLAEALSYVTPPIHYASDASTSTTSTTAVGDPPTEVALWDGYFDEVNQFPFDQEPKFEEPRFINYNHVRYEEGVRTAFQTNICEVLNTLMGPDYEFSRLRDGNPGIPDFNCHYVEQLMFCIEDKRALVIGDIGERTFPEYYESSTKARTVIQQVYNYMCSKNLQYSALSTYEDHWFLRRPDETPTKLFISRALSSESKSPTVLEAYAYMAMRARASPPSPNPVIKVPIDEESGGIKPGPVTRSRTDDNAKEQTQQSPDASANPQNFSPADFKFMGLLGEGRSGKTLLCEFRGEEIALKTADLYKTPPNILKEMQKEVQIYKEDLKDIQGKYIPRLVCDGYYGGGWCYILGTTFVGKHLSNDNMMPKKQKDRALEALNQIHKRGVLHNDIREENILLDSEGRVYLIDFGMALQLDRKKKRKFDAEKLKFSLLLDRYTV